MIACGTAATEQATAVPAETTATSVPAEVMDSTPAPDEAMGTDGVPTATPEPAMESSTVTVPAGTLNVGQKEIGRYDGHPKLVVNPALFVSQTAPPGEGLVLSDLNREMKGWPAESWEFVEEAQAPVLDDAGGERPLEADSLF